jgi:fucose 4-O-acetylase-like acetyltransferase
MYILKASGLTSLIKSIPFVLVNYLIAFCLFQIRALYKYHKLIASEKDAGVSSKKTLG